MKWRYAMRMAVASSSRSRTTSCCPRTRTPLPARCSPVGAALKLGDRGGVPSGGRDPGAGFVTPSPISCHDIPPRAACPEPICRRTPAATTQPALYLTAHHHTRRTPLEARRTAAGVGTFTWPKTGTANWPLTEPPLLKPPVGPQPFVLLGSPTHQVGVDALQEGRQPRPVEPAVVVHPAHHDRVDHRGKLDQIAPDPHVQTPLTHLLPHRGEGVLADRGQEPGVTATPVLAQGLPRTEREPQERERRVLVIAPSNAVLAVSGSPGESHPQAPTERSVTVSRHSALTTQSAGTGESMPSARTAWVALHDPSPPRLQTLEPTQPPVLLPRPLHQVGVDACEEGIHLGPVEPAPVDNPPAHDRVDRPGEVVQSVVRPPVKPPAANLPTLLDQLVPAHRGLKGREINVLPFVPRSPRTEGVPQERERDILVRFSSIAVLAVNHRGLVGVQLQPDVNHPLPDCVSQHFCLLPTDAMHHRIIHVAFEPHGRETPGHPGIECVVEEEVGQHGRNSRTLRGAAVALVQGPVGML